MAKRIALPILIVIGLLIVACSGNTSAPQIVPSTPVADLPINANRAQATPIPQTIIDTADAEYMVLTNVFERLAPSVVNIEVVAEIGENTGILDFSGGSGFIYDTDGRIITNAHVVNGAEAIRVTFYDGYVADATVVGIDLFSDIAVIQVETDSSRLIPVTIISSDGVRVGQRAIAIGNPFGLATSMSVGIVSGLGRQLRSAELIDATTEARGFQNPSIIQIDTPINPGNSGGPLLNSNGEVIGINTAIRTTDGVFQGVGFAVPSNTLRRVIPDLINIGQVEYSWLGISAPASENGLSVASLAEPLNLPVTSGVLVSSVTPGSPAANGGLRGGTHFEIVRNRQICAGGDIIVAVEGLYIANMDELVTYLVQYTRPGDTISLLVVRDGETFETEVTLESRPASTTIEPCTER